MIHFRIRDDTLCGKSYKEPSKKAAKDGRLCDDCVQVMWQEQYRRNTLQSYTKKIDKSKIKTETTDTKPESNDSRLVSSQHVLPLRSYLELQ